MESTSDRGMYSEREANVTNCITRNNRLNTEGDDTSVLLELSASDECIIILSTLQTGGVIMHSSGMFIFTETIGTSTALQGFNRESTCSWA